MAGMTFPIPLPVILSKEDEKPASVDEQKKQTELLEKQTEMEEIYLDMFGMSNQKDEQDRKIDRKNKKSESKLNKEWEKLKIGKFFPNLLKKIGIMALGLAALGGGLLSGLFNDLMELMLFAAVDPNGGLLGSFINALIPLFLNLLVMIVNVLVKLLPVLIKTFIKMLPVFLKALLGVIDAIIDAIPMIIDAFIIATPLIIDALIKAIPKIVTALMDGVLKTMEELVKRFPAFKPIADFISNIANAIKELFSAGGGDIKTKLMTFASSIFTTLLDAIKDLLSKGLELLIDGLKNLYNELGFLGKVIMVMIGLIALAVIGYQIYLGVMALVALAPVILSIAMTAVALIIAAFPFLLAALIIVGLIYLVNLIVENWDAIVNFFVDGWNSLTKWLGDMWDQFGEMIMDGIRLLLLPFTWPIELGLYIFKNWKKISKKIEDGLNYVLKMFANIGPDIKNKLIGFINWIKNFDLGATIRNVIASAFENIPGLNTIRNFFNEIGRWIEQQLADLGLGSSSGTGAAGGGAVANVIDSALGGVEFEDRFSNLIKVSLQSGSAISAQTDASLTAEQIAGLNSLTEAIKTQARQQQLNPQELGASTDAESLRKLEDIVKAIKNSNSGIPPSLRSSNTARR